MGWLDTIGQLLSPAVQTVSTIGRTVVSGAQGAVAQGQSVVANTIATRAGTVSPVQTTSTISIPQQTVNMGALPSVGATANLPKPTISNLATAPTAPYGQNLYVPYGERTQTELKNAKAAIDAKSGEVAFYQQAINPYTGKPRTGTYEGGINIGGGGRAALQSGMFSAAPLTPDVRTQAVPATYAKTADVARAVEVRASPELFSRLGAEVYGGTVQRLDASKTVESTKAIYGRFPEASGNLANLVSPQGANLSKKDYPGSSIPSTLPVGAPSISFMSDKGLQGAAPSPFKPFAAAPVAVAGITANQRIANSGLPAGVVFTGAMTKVSAPVSKEPTEFAGFLPDVSQSRIGAYIEANKSKPLQAGASLLASGAVSAKSSFEGASRETLGMFTFGASDVLLPKQTDATEKQPYGEWSKFGSGAGRVVRAGLGIKQTQIDAYGEQVKSQPGLAGDWNRIVYGAGTFITDRPTSLAPAALAGAGLLVGGGLLGSAVKVIAPGTAVAGTAASYALTGVKAGVGVGLGIAMIGGVTEWGKASKEQTEINVGKSLPVLGAMIAGGGGMNWMERPASIVKTRVVAGVPTVVESIKRPIIDYNIKRTSTPPMPGIEVPAGWEAPLGMGKPTPKTSARTTVEPVISVPVARNEPARITPPRILDAEFTLLPKESAKSVPKMPESPSAFDINEYAKRGGSLFSRIPPKIAAKSAIDAGSIVGSYTPEGTQVATVAKPEVRSLASGSEFGTQASLPAGISFRELTGGFKPAGLLTTPQYSVLPKGQRAPTGKVIFLDSPSLPRDIREKIYADAQSEMLHNKEYEIYKLYRADTGEPIYRVTGEKARVKVNVLDIERELAKLPPGTITVEIHGHPGGSPHSGVDLSMNPGRAHIKGVIGAEPRGSKNVDTGVGVYRRIHEISTWGFDEPVPVVSKNLQTRVQNKLDAKLMSGELPSFGSNYDYHMEINKQAASRKGLKYTSVPVKPPYEIVKAPKPSVAEFMREVMGKEKTRPETPGEFREEIIRNPSEYLKTRAAEVKAQRSAASNVNAKVAAIKSNRAEVLGRFDQRGNVGMLESEVFQPSVAPMGVAPKTAYSRLRSKAIDMIPEMSPMSVPEYGQKATVKGRPAPRLDLPVIPSKNRAYIKNQAKFEKGMSRLHKTSSISQEQVPMTREMQKVMAPQPAETGTIHITMMGGKENPTGFVTGQSPLSRKAFMPKQQGMADVIMARAKKAPVEKTPYTGVETKAGGGILISRAAVEARPATATRMAPQITLQQQSSARADATFSFLRPRRASRVRVVEAEQEYYVTPEGMQRPAPQESGVALRRMQPELSLSKEQAARTKQAVAQWQEPATRIAQMQRQRSKSELALASASENLQIARQGQRNALALEAESLPRLSPAQKFGDRILPKVATQKYVERYQEPISITEQVQKRTPTTTRPPIEKATPKTTPYTPFVEKPVPPIEKPPRYIPDKPIPPPEQKPIIPIIPPLGKWDFGGGGSSGGAGAPGLFGVSHREIIGIKSSLSAFGGGGLVRRRSRR